jgi:hypothetical protein
MANNVELHRLLLVELRRDLPQTRDEAFDYWSNVRTLAAKAEPALAPPADGVILKIDNYFDWSDRTPNPNAPTDEYLDAYFDWQVDYTTSGAGAYVDAVETFTNYALEAVITQLDSVVLRLE